MSQTLPDGALDVREPGVFERFAAWVSTRLRHRRIGVPVGHFSPQYMVTRTDEHDGVVLTVCDGEAFCSVGLTPAMASVLAEMLSPSAQ